MKTLTLIRHGATAGNLEKRYIGRTDEPLCPLGIAQAERLREQGFFVDALFVSPALRARQTAQLVFPNMPYTVVDGLMETDFGMFEGKCAQELQNDPFYQAWLGSDCLGPVPGGESAAEFKPRCCSAFYTAAQALPEHARAAFVIHGGVIMAILEAYASPPRGFYESHVGNGEFVQCEYDGRMLRIVGGALYRQGE